MTKFIQAAVGDYLNLARVELIRKAVDGNVFARLIDGEIVELGKGETVEEALAPLIPAYASKWKARCDEAMAK